MSSCFLNLTFLPPSTSAHVALTERPVTFFLALLTVEASTTPSRKSLPDNRRQVLRVILVFARYAGWRPLWTLGSMLLTGVIMSKQAFKRVRRFIGMEVNREPLPSFAWPGGYPIAYLCGDGECMCPKCVNDNIALVADACRNNDTRCGWCVVHGDVLWEGPPIICANCNAPIESAYGDPYA